MGKPLVILSFCLIVSSVCLSGVKGFGSIVGGRTEVRDVKTNEEVQELGRFSVEEFNRNQIMSSSSNGQLLMFSQVVEAQKQVVSGIKYFLKIQAIKNGQTSLFDSVVVVKPWLHSKDLLHFAPSTDHQIFGVLINV